MRENSSRNLQGGGEKYGNENYFFHCRENHPNIFIFAKVFVNCCIFSRANFCENDFRNIFRFTVTLG